MKKLFFSLFLLTLLPLHEVSAQQKPKSIWDDPSESNPYFTKERTKTGADIKRENTKKRDYYKTTFKRRVYEGPTPEQAAKEAQSKAVENFKTYLPEGSYDVRFESVDYDANSDILSFKKLVFLPRENTAEAKKIPHYLLAEEARFSGFNIGEIYGTPQNETGLIQLTKLEVPVWNEGQVKVGKMTFDQLELNGKGLALIKEKKGSLDTALLAGFKSEKVINETILNNIVRSKVFAANKALFRNPSFDPEFFEAVKDQSLNGLSFSSAVINEKNFVMPEAVSAEMISYSARVLNPDLVLGARLEGGKKKEDQKPTLDQIKKNVEKINSEKAKLVKEMKK